MAVQKKTGEGYEQLFLGLKRKINRNNDKLYAMSLVLEAKSDIKADMSGKHRS